MRHLLALLIVAAAAAAAAAADRTYYSPDSQIVPAVQSLITSASTSVQISANVLTDPAIIGSLITSLTGTTGTIVYSTSGMDDHTTYQTWNATSPGTTPSLKQSATYSITWRPAFGAPTIGPFYWSAGAPDSIPADGSISMSQSGNLANISTLDVYGLDRSPEMNAAAAQSPCDIAIVGQLPTTLTAVLDVTSGTANRRAASQLIAAGATVYLAEFPNRVGNHLVIADSATLATGNYQYSAGATQLGSYLAITSDSGALTKSATTFAALVASGTQIYSRPAPRLGSAPGTIRYAFSPGGQIAPQVCASIAAAQKTIRVAAYTFTNPQIAAALIAAKSRGVDVQIIFDAHQSTAHGSMLATLRAGGVPVLIDGVEPIYHDKFMVIDSAQTIVGSYNWSTAAETVNAEEILWIADDQIAAAFTANWNFHAAHSLASVNLSYPPTQTRRPLLGRFRRRWTYSSTSSLSPAPRPQSPVSSCGNTSCANGVCRPASTR
jgi:hypothetical protein